jgi:3-deoxy-D-manno-octulosonic-acid transferase
MLGLFMLIRIIYSFLLFLVAPFFLYGLYKHKENKPKFGKRWTEHFGFTPALKNSQTKPLWIHTVSVGEVIAAVPLIKLLKKQNPHLTILVTTTTSTGAAEIEKLGSIIEHRYMPFDFNWSIRRFIKVINPSALLIMETELWPNTLHVAHQYHIPISIINARLSEQSFLRYKKFQFVFNLLANNIDMLLCQTKDDALRFEKLGIQTEKIQVTGSIKFDISITDKTKKEGKILRDQLGKKHPIWIAASTHQGEDEIILAAHKKLLKKWPNSLLIIVPRHPERFSNVMVLSESENFDTVNRTGNAPVTDSTSVYIGDTMGEMLTLIYAADICFMGGSLLGKKVGGHNLLEPAALEKPCLTGPSYYNFKLITEQLIKSEGCLVCSTAEDISNNIDYLFSGNDKVEKMGKLALNVVNTNKGALEHTAKLLSVVTVQ